MKISFSSKVKYGCAPDGPCTKVKPLPAKWTKESLWWVIPELILAFGLESYFKIPPYNATNKTRTSPANACPKI